MISRFLSLYSSSSLSESKSKSSESEIQRIKEGGVPSLWFSLDFFNSYSSCFWFSNIVVARRCSLLSLTTNDIKQLAPFSMS